MLDSLKAFSKYTDSETFSKIVDYSCVNRMWKHCVQSYADKSAVVDSKDYTFVEVEKEVSSLRAILKANDVCKKDVVGIYCPNSFGFVRAFIAVTTLGCCAVLLPPQLPDMAVCGLSMKMHMKALIYDRALEANVKNVKVKTIASDEVYDSYCEGVDVEPESACAVVFTGGTTGKSKGALLSNRAVMRGTKNGCYGIKDVFYQRYVQILPMTHVFGLIRTLLTSLYTGSSLYICRNNKDMFKDIAVHRPTIMVMVPALAELALGLSTQFKKNMLGSDLKTIISGAAVVPPYLVRECEKLGIALLPGYGLTESANLVSGNPEALKKSSSVGIVYPDMEVKVVDGELWLKGPNMMDCYVGEDEENKNAYEDGWFKTGDLVRFDEEGFLYITGRKKEIIVLSNGENISPAEIETKINEIDCIQDSLVYESDGNLAVQILPRMTVVKAQGISDVEAFVKAQIENLNKVLPSYERINKVIIRNQDFVRTPSMKIARGKNGES